MNLTDNEFKVMDAIVKSYYGEFITDEVWTKYMAMDSNLSPKVFSGTMSSLTQKGLVVSHKATSTQEDDATCALTDKGARLYESLVPNPYKKPDERP
jgi:predicted transcriptional regulator